MVETNVADKAKFSKPYFAGVVWAVFLKDG